MSETIDNTQPNKATQPVKAQRPEPAQEPEPTTQEVKPRPRVKLGGRIGRFFLNILIFLTIIGLGIFGGYQSGIGIRQRAQRDLTSQQLNDQFSRALVDMQFGNYSAAQTRLEYILEINPSYPGAMEKLTEVMVLSNMPTATPVVSPTPELIVDDSNYEALLAQAKQLVSAGQWQNALVVLDTLRVKDPSFHTVEVDGMYYFALRNLGVDQIKAGNLEGGIYSLTLAERFGPLDNIAHYLRENARFYIAAASFWGLDWKVASENFFQLSGSGIWDGTMTANERYRIATINYANELYEDEQYCAAYEQYQAAGQLDAEALELSELAYIGCYPPTPTIGPTIIVTETPATLMAPTNTPEGGAPTNTTAPPTAAPPTTEPPPTEPPATEPPATATP